MKRIKGFTTLEFILALGIFVIVMFIINNLMTNYLNQFFAYKRINSFYTQSSAIFNKLDKVIKEPNAKISISNTVRTNTLQPNNMQDETDSYFVRITSTETEMEIYIRDNCLTLKEKHLLQKIPVSTETYTDIKGFTFIKTERVRVNNQNISSKPKYFDYIATNLYECILQNKDMTGIPTPRYLKRMFYVDGIE